jgi:lipopolysaccharide/colanic/teichoic acid biosynthesis glycosyltransferase
MIAPETLKGNAYTGVSTPYRDSMPTRLRMIEQEEEIFPWAVFSYRYRTLKRILDVTLLFCICPLLFLLGGLIILAIRLNSPGPVFYRHERIGRFGVPIGVWKFRTMFVNGDQVMEEYFRNNPEAREEWRVAHKLKNDPRVTSIGRFLRKTSLDEIPQALNVILGEMSLIGPRPIVQSEVDKYGDVFPLYTHVKPGISGLWQVSGRCDLTYAERVALDARYVMEWTLRRDLKILIRTIPVLLGGRGAY